MKPICASPVDWPVSASRRAYRAREYLRISVEVSEVEPKVTMRPAACQVVPEVSRSRSSSTMSCQPMSARWYATEVPMMPPPMTTTRARAGRAAPVGLAAVTSAASPGSSGSLAPAVADSQAEHARLIGRVANVEVAGVGVDDRVLVREVGDEELGKPALAARVQAKAQIHDGVGRLQEARQVEILCLGVGGIPHCALVSHVELYVAVQRGAERMLVAGVPAPAEVRRERQPLIDVGVIGRTHRGGDARVVVGARGLQRPVVAYLVIDVGFCAVGARIADVDAEAGGGADGGVVDEGLQVLPLHVVDGGVPLQPAAEVHGLQSQLEVIERVGGVSEGHAVVVAALRCAGVSAAVAEPLTPVGIHHRLIGDLVVD